MSSKTGPRLTEKGTPHTPTHKRTLSGKLVSLDEPPRLGFVELVTDFTMSQPRPEPKERLGAHYGEMRSVPGITKKRVCSLCGTDDPAKPCEKGTDSWFEHAWADGYTVNRSIKRRLGWRSGYRHTLAARLAL